MKRAPESVPLIVALPLFTLGLFAGTGAAEGPTECTFDQTAMVDVLTEIRSFLGEHDAQLEDAHFSIRIADRGEATRAELKRLLLREEACCSHLTFKTKTDRMGFLIVEVSGPAEEVFLAAQAISNNGP